MMAIQAEFHDEPSRIPQSTGLVNFAQFTGGILGLGVAATIFGNQLTVDIAKYAPDLPSQTVSAVRQSVQTIFTLSSADQENIVKAYSEALSTCPFR